MNQGEVYILSNNFGIILVEVYEFSIKDLFVILYDEYDITGSIYRGKVKKIIPEVNSALVDIGNGQLGFLANINKIEDSRLLKYYVLL